VPSVEMGKGRSVYRHYSTGAPHAKRGGDGERGHRVLVLDPVPLHHASSSNKKKTCHRAATSLYTYERTSTDWRKRDAPWQVAAGTRTYLLFQRVDELGQLLVGSLRRRRLPRGHGHHVPRQPLACTDRGACASARAEVRTATLTQRQEEP
jgi:hypothetical protein